MFKVNIAKDFTGDIHSLRNMLSENKLFLKDRTTKIQFTKIIKKLSDRLSITD